jgi:hypothetical protein
MVDPLDQLPLRTDRIERLQQQRAQQSLRRDRLAAEQRIELLNLAGQRCERGIGNRANHPQRVIPRIRLSRVYVAEKAATNRIVAAHCRPFSHPKGSQCANFATLFQQPVSVLEGDRWVAAAMQRDPAASLP